MGVGVGQLPTASILGCCCPKEGWWIGVSHFGHIEAECLDQWMRAVLGPELRPARNKKEERTLVPHLGLLVVGQWGSDTPLET